MQSSKEMIKKLFFPYDKQLSVALISNEEQNCVLFNNMLHSIFDSNDSVLNHIGNVQHSKDKDTFNFIINASTIIKFSIHNLVIDSNVTVTNFQNHDILIPIFCFNKYAPHEYDNIATETEYVLKTIIKTNESVIISYLNAEYIFQNPIEDEVQWQFASNELHKLVIDNGVELEIRLIEQGKASLKGLFKVFNYHSKQQRKFGITRKVNFFYCNNTISEIVFGKNEFIANLLMQMLTFDKLNSYNFQIN